MTGSIREATVNGMKFKVWSDYIKIATFAEDQSGQVKPISKGGYITNDLTVRKAIATVFHLPTFRKSAVKA